MSRIYLDHASTSPLRESARAAMAEVADAGSHGLLGDPGRIHAEGMAARATLEDARDRVAHWLGVRARQVVFTSGATESIAAVSWVAVSGGGHVVSSAVEHSAVRTWAQRCADTEVGVDPTGTVDVEELSDAVRDDTAIVHLQWANHEVATMQPVAEAVAALDAMPGLLHVDAAQAGPAAPQVARSGADVVTLSGHKLGGPTGIGVTVVRRNLRLAPLMVGGDQERARRAGVENIAAAVGLAAVADELASTGAGELDRLAGLSSQVIDWAARTDGVSLLGHPDERAPHLVCLALDGIEPQPVLLGLDQRGVAVHSGSSCSSEAFEPSPVLLAMGVDAQRSLRISAGWSSTEADVDRALSALDEVLSELRALGRGTR